jgi:nucleotide-binding universal stress UspA family protein
MKMLIALDGSEKDDAVLDFSGRLARAAGAEVTLVHALNPWVDPPEATTALFHERLEQIRQQWQDRLEAQARRFPNLPTQARAEWRCRPPDEPYEEVADCLARVAREVGADLVVVASKRAAGVAGLLLGSTAQALLRLSPCPVLVVRPPAAAHGAGAAERSA